MLNTFTLLFFWYYQRTGLAGLTSVVSQVSLSFDTVYYTRMVFRSQHFFSYFHNFFSQSVTLGTITLWMSIRRCIFRFKTLYEVLTIKRLGKQVKRFKMKNMRSQHYCLQVEDKRQKCLSVFTAGVAGIYWYGNN